MSYRPGYSRSPILAILLLCAALAIIVWIVSTWPDRAAWLVVVALLCVGAVLACLDGGSDGGTPG